MRKTHRHVVKRQVIWTRVVPVRNTRVTILNLFF